MFNETAQRLRSKAVGAVPRCAFCFTILLAYLLLGGVAFKTLEYQARDRRVRNGLEELEQERSQLVQVLWAQTIANSEDDWSAIANEKLDIYEKTIKEYLIRGIDLTEDDAADDVVGEDDNPWNFIGSVFYCFTVVTTIGYGNLAPATQAGRVFTIAYGFLGIPLALFVINEFGKMLTICLKFFTAVVRRTDDYYDDDDSSQDFNFSLLSAVAVTCAYLTLGSLFFWSLEDWSFLEANYFSFVTFSTIGFGDFVPSKLEWLLFTMIYVFSALALCAMCFNLIQSKVDTYLSEKQQAVIDWWHHVTEPKEAGSSKKDEDEDTPNKTTYYSSQIPRYKDGTGSNVTHRKWGANDEEEEEEVEDE